MKKAGSSSPTIVRITPLPAGAPVCEAERALVRLLARQAAAAYLDALRNRATRD